jgi:hypothetical protein
MDVGGGDHGAIAFGPGSILDASGDPPPALSEDPAVAFAGLIGVAFAAGLGDSDSHSKTSGFRNSEDVYDPPLFGILRGFSSLFRVPDAETLKITLG